MRSEPTLWTDETNPQELRRRADDLARDGMIAMAAEFRDRAEWLESTCRRCGGGWGPGVSDSRLFPGAAASWGRILPEIWHRGNEVSGHKMWPKMWLKCGAERG